MSEFGHLSSIIQGCCIDYWGAGPFIIEIADKSYRFEDSDRFGPQVIRKNGEISAAQPGERSPFWKAHTAWVKQGRRTEDDRQTCVYEPLKPTKFRRVNGRNLIVEYGDADGNYEEVS